MINCSERERAAQRICMDGLARTAPPLEQPACRRRDLLPRVKAKETFANPNAQHWENVGKTIREI